MPTPNALQSWLSGPALTGVVTTFLAFASYILIDWKANLADVQRRQVNFEVSFTERLMKLDAIAQVSSVKMTTIMDQQIELIRKLAVDVQNLKENNYKNIRPQQ